MLHYLSIVIGLVISTGMLFGSDDRKPIGGGAFEVNATGPDREKAFPLCSDTPVAPACTPATLESQPDFGISSVSFNDLYNPSDDAATEGYISFVCEKAEVLEGKTYTLSALTDEPTTHNVAAWIDFDNDGTFDTSSEEVLSQESVTNPSAEVSIPSDVPLNTPLRLRISADHDLGNPVPTPCMDLQYGQAEDYTVLVKENALPPKADFEAKETFSCDRTVEFINRSKIAPDSYSWDFGDGNTSSAPEPVHDYDSSGIYTVWLIASKDGENDTLTRKEYIEVDTDAAVKAPSCTPQTLSYCCNYGIYGVQLNQIGHSSGDASEGYQDRSCQVQAVIRAGESTNVQVLTGPDNPQDTRIWIDLNNNGSFEEPDELVFEAADEFDPSGTFMITDPEVVGKPLRMRVSSDVIGDAFGPCSDMERGQVEDFGVILDKSNDRRAIGNPAKELRLSPLPARERVHLHYEGSVSRPITIVIRDMTGRSVLKKVQGKRKSLDSWLRVSHLSPGVYVITLETPNGRALAGQKLIIER